MQRESLISFLTLVLLVSAASSHGAPHEHSSPSAEDEAPEEQTKKLDPNMIVTPAPETGRAKSEPLDKGYFPYRQSFTLRAGMVEDGDEQPYLLGFMYLIPNRRSPQLEAGADLLSDNRGHITAAVRWTINEFGYFRPFYKGGLTCEMEPKEQLAGLAKIENYLARAGVGLEYVLQRPISVRVEAEATAGTEETAVYFSAGCSWAW